MKNKAALVTFHGMGDTPETYADALFGIVKKRLHPHASSLHLGRIYYQKILQDNETHIWDRVAHQVRWSDLRKFLLFGFADAAGLESRKDCQHSVYEQTQRLIAQELLKACRHCEDDAPLVLLAQSLGCQVMSCYLWDASQHAKGFTPSVGVWHDVERLSQEINHGEPFTPAELRFMRGETIKYIYTTGCNIPIFVAAHYSVEILPSQPNEHFEWHNYYDKDDVLGWPLASLSEQYAAVVKDHPMNSGGNDVLGWISASWNPLSHEKYWEDSEVLNPLTQHLKECIKAD